MLGRVARAHQGKRRMTSRTGLAVGAALAFGLTGSVAHAFAGVKAVAQSPVAEWRLDDAAGLIAADATGNGNLGTVSGGATWLTAGAAEGSGAIALDGVDGNVHVPDAPGLDPKEVTISAWVRGDPTHPPVSGAPILEKGAFGCAGPSYGLYVTADGIGLRTTNPVDLVYTPSVASVTAHVANLWDGRWHLVAAAIPLAFGEPSIAIDGAIVTVIGSGGGLPTDSVIKYSGSSSADLVIGGPASTGCGAPTFHGDIDDVRLYASADAINNIGALMAPESIGITLDPVADMEAGGFKTVTAHVSPMPRFGYIQFQVMQTDTHAVQNSVFGVADWVAGTFSASIQIVHPNAYTIHAWLVAGPPYQDASADTPWTVVPMSTTTVLSVSPLSPNPTQAITLTADVSSASLAFEPYPAGSVDFVELTPGGNLTLGSAALDPWDVDTSRSTLLLPNGLGVGTHHLVARYVGPDEYRAGSQSTPYVLGISTAPTFVNAFGPGSVETHHPVNFSASVGSPIDGWQAGATMDFSAVGSSAPGCTGVPVDPENSTRCTIPSLPVGHYQYQVSYSGNALVAGSTSPLLDVQVVADTVDATGVGVSSTSLYPFRDGYLDTVAIRGSRTEPLAVAIRIYAPSGALVRSTKISRNAGSYRFTWNGRTASGGGLTAGKYKVVQTLTDAFATHRSYIAYVTLSPKRLFTYTTTIARTAAQYYRKTGSWIGWSLSLPSATLYKSLTLSVYGYTIPTTGSPGLQLGAWDFRICAPSAAWSPGCVSHAVMLNGPNPAWTSMSLSTAYNRYGHSVRAFVFAPPGASGRVTSIRLKVTYGVLK